ncbi:uncharacterized protein LOC121375212 isoform X2 [Gigantopelta aegis]|uniref:uncharacterized protein LOC121375212 isoform X2 n=1 Tax=Gigantopelta aegis TaxID=1735272 RepID=UPI001B888325|nr:uncharacterized protein LOC121375212 isoform X2 [Gigantopelta aegis]
MTSHPTCAAVYAGQRLRCVNISKIVRCVFIVALLMHSCVAYPRIEEQRGDTPGAVYFRTRFCKPLSEEDLERLMGSAYDRSRMTNNEEEAKRSFVKDDSDIDSDRLSHRDADSSLQGDDPNAGYVDSYGEHDDGYPPDHSRGKQFDRDFHSDSFHSKYQTNRKKYQFMRKKRDVLDDDSLLHLKLLLSEGRSRKKLRKQLKKKLKQEIRKSNILNKKPPWECEMNEAFVKKEGFFPRYVRSGRCKTDKCFYKLYNCEPQLYGIKLLQRDPHQCNPVPTIGSNTTYEEKWIFIKHTVTVGCNCVRKEKPKRRRRH